VIAYLQRKKLRALEGEREENGSSNGSSYIARKKAISSAEKPAHAGSHALKT